MMFARVITPSAERQRLGDRGGVYQVALELEDGTGFSLPSDATATWRAVGVHTEAVVTGTATIGNYLGTTRGGISHTITTEDTAREDIFRVTFVVTWGSAGGGVLTIPQTPINGLFMQVTP